VLDVAVVEVAVAVVAEVTVVAVTVVVDRVRVHGSSAPAHTACGPQALQVPCATAVSS
jgi:hypothetical protein